MKEEGRRLKAEGRKTNRMNLSFVLFFLFSVFGLLLISAFSLQPSAFAKIYIDITSPAIRKLPISITSKGAFEAKAMEWVIKNDLEFTGIFSFVDPGVPGAEMTVFIEADTSDGIKVLASINDMIENREVFKKQYLGKNMRSIAHSISNEIYKLVTGNNGVFRTAISYLAHLSSGVKELYVMEWDGNNPLKIVSKGLMTSHSWSNDGGLLFYSSEKDHKWKIYAFDLGEFRERVLFHSTGLNLVGNASARGEVAFSSSRDGNSEIYVVNLDGGNLKKLTKSFGIDVSPVFSPDGSKIAFVSDRGGSPQIYLMDPDGGLVRRVTFEGSYNTSPSWSPDGKWLAFVGMKDGKNQIFMLKSDSTELRQLTFDGNNESPSFSPDGMFLAFDSDRDGSRGIYIMRVNGGEQKKITPKHIRAMSPKWSPYLK
ncbi:MAG: PD40 domain-containing protein [Nitrospirae bacterium]|nr:PD40 domain-containing protein [Nitrospirota bacterium]